MANNEPKAYIRIDVAKKSIAWIAIILIFIMGAGARTEIGNWVNATWLKGDGGNLTNLNGTNISQGTIPDSRFSSNVSVAPNSQLVFADRLNVSDIQAKLINYQLG